MLHVTKKICHRAHTVHTSIQFNFHTVHRPSIKRQPFFCFYCYPVLEICIVTGNRICRLYSAQLTTVPYHRTISKQCLFWSYLRHFFHENWKDICRTFAIFPSLSGSASAGHITMTSLFENSSFHALRDIVRERDRHRRIVREIFYQINHFIISLSVEIWRMPMMNIGQEL